MQYTGLSYLEGFPPRWCFYCEADFIIYLYAKLNPRLGLTYLSFRIPKLGVSPHYLSSSRRLFLQPLPPSLSPLLSSPLSSSFAFLDMQAVTQSLLLLWRGCGCEKWRTAPARPPQKTEKGEGEGNGDEQEEAYKSKMGQDWGSRNNKEEEER